MYELAKRPDIQQHVAAEIRQQLGDAPAHTWTADQLKSNMPWLNGCINETLRLWPAGGAQARMTKEDTIIDGYLCPKGSMVSLDIYALHRHEGIWPQPTEWLPERWLPDHQETLGPRKSNAFLPFGAGARTCIGRYLATMEMQVLTASLLRDFELQPDPVRVPEPSVALTIKTKNGVWLVARERT